MNPIDIIDAAKPAETTVPLCLRGDLVAEFEHLERQLDEAKNEQADSLAGNVRAREIAEKIEALREDMKASTVVFRLRAMPRRAYRELVDAHPPRRDPDGSLNVDDAEMQVNNLTFFDPLIKACIVEPLLDEPRLTRLLDESLSDRQFDQLASAAILVNRGVVNVPFSSAASRLLETSDGE